MTQCQAGRENCAEIEAQIEPNFPSAKAIENTLPASAPTPSKPNRNRKLLLSENCGLPMPILSEELSEKIVADTDRHVTETA
jgi:hypothetical protein